MLEVLLETDFNGNGDISGTERTFLTNNRLCEADDPDFLYPLLLAAGTAFADFVSADLGASLDVF